jgi:hypothetical protein
MNAMESLVRYGYLVIFGAVFAEQIGLPFPSEPFLLAGGGLAGSGRLEPRRRDRPGGRRLADRRHVLVLARPHAGSAGCRSSPTPAQAAAALGLSRTRFYTLLRRYGLD